MSTKKESTPPLSLDQKALGIVVLTDMTAKSQEKVTYFYN